MQHIIRSLRRFTVPGFALLVLALAPADATATPSTPVLAPASVVAGDTVVASGTVTPALAGEQVRIEEQIDGDWLQLGTVVTTDATGAWSATLTPKRGGQVRATQLTGTADSSAATALTVAPRILGGSIARGPVYPFIGTTGTWRIAPATYPNGRVRIELSIDGRAAGFVRTRIVDGVVRAHLPARGVGRFRARLVLGQVSGYAAATAPVETFVVRGRAVGPGSSRTWNRALRTALRFRGFHVPGGTSYSSQLGDAVIAFHKAYGRARTTSFEAGDWTRLTRKAVAVRYGGAGMHLEVDKGRQILMQVTNGRPTFIIHVSSGATGNTPVGRHSILWKGNWVPSLYGALLYKSMAFQGAFAIHGYPSVPTTPASHGCVRVPMWIAATLYAKTPVGTTVYVYEGPGSTRPSLGRDRRAAADVPELTGVDVARWADER